MNPDEQATHLETLREALGERDLGSWVDRETPTIPVLWVPVPQTCTSREMVHVSRTADGPQLVWDQRYWHVDQADELADKLARHIGSIPPTRPAGRWGRDDAAAP